jgi:hypothetical protein
MFRMGGFVAGFCAWNAFELCGGQGVEVESWNVTR